MENRTSLEKSHSKMSNFKLTLITLLELISFSGIWISLIIKNEVENPVFIIALVASIVVFVLSYLMFRKFKR